MDGQFCEWLAKNAKLITVNHHPIQNSLQQSSFFSNLTFICLHLNNKQGVLCRTVDWKCTVVSS